ncbi:hypothetical protein HELRODRAFT_164106 [Helobdella robusta]|uniref:Endonuclease/exonuclease/phosphatase domain-containing protein n=1 Tax=Helobdella robusta TaxID=6412 RepID=T1EUX6_HELRO|nr:hypothetical protein HELRODRAFT_164106 [Helobdella robusta]ESN94291.1 hypothetical protein HELRODRAFT_164106 [Helobdella robusta]
MFYNIHFTAFDNGPQYPAEEIAKNSVHGVAVQGPVDGLATGTPLFSVAVQGIMDGRITCRPRVWRFGTWNVGTLTGRSLEVVKLQRRMVDVAALQEIRWKGEYTRPDVRDICIYIIPVVSHETHQ